MFHVPHDSDPRDGNRLVGTVRYREIKLNCESETRNNRLFRDTSEVSYMVFSPFLEAYLVNLHGTVLNTTYLFVSSVLIVNEPGLATSLHWKNG